MTETTMTLDQPEGGGGARKGLGLVAVVAVVVAAVLGGSAFAVYTFFFAGGPQVAEALPASTVALVSIDLNPSAGQKVAAIKTIRKFPALKKQLGLRADDDLRKYVVDKLVDENDCAGLDFDRDVKPWLGKRAALAAVDLGGDAPAPVLALQVSDEQQARSGFAKIEDCADLGDFGYVVRDGYLIGSDTEAKARKVVAATAKGTLGGDASYRKWTEAVGDQGVVSFYVGRKAAGFLADGAGQFGSAFGAPAAPATSDDPSAAMRKALKDFKGMAGTVRFADGGMELAFASGGMQDLTGRHSVGKQVGNLPADTAAMLGLAVPRGFATHFLDQLRSTFGDLVDQTLAQAESQSGLKLPEDVQTLLGDGLTVSLGGSAPANVDDIAAPADVPFGLAVRGDVDAIKDVIARLEKHNGQTLSDLQVATRDGDGTIAFAANDDYAKALVGDGDLGGSDRFARAVPHLDDASAVLYLDFDSDWVPAILASLADDEGQDTADEAKANLDPLEAFGVSAWSEGDTSHFLAKVTTD